MTERRRRSGQPNNLKKCTKPTSTTPITSPPLSLLLTFLVLSRSKECVKGLYSPPAEDKQRTGMPTEAGEAPERARALRAAREAATRSAEAISSVVVVCARCVRGGGGLICERGVVAVVGKGRSENVVVGSLPAWAWGVL